MIRWLRENWGICVPVLFVLVIIAIVCGILLWGYYNETL